VAPDHEHDEFAWWPAEIEQWPQEADEPLRRIGTLLADAE
jgi:8-oxo-dGTP diphosphatase